MNCQPRLYSQEYISINQYNMLIDHQASSALLIPVFKSSNEGFGIILVRQGHYRGFVFKIRISLPEDFECTLFSEAYFLPNLFPPPNVIETGQNQFLQLPTWYPNNNFIWQIRNVFYKLDFTSYGRILNENEANFKNVIQNVILEDLPIFFRNHFSGMWNTLPHEIIKYLICDNQIFWNVGYLFMLKLIKCYDYENSTQLGLLNQYLRDFLEIMKRHMNDLYYDQSELSLTIQKHILKIFYKYTHLHLCMDVISYDMFSYWMSVLCAVSTRPDPLEMNNVDPNIRRRCRKWALHAISKFLERYFNPYSVNGMYKKCTGKIVETLMIICEQYSHGTYITSKTLRFVITSFEYLIRHPHSWNYLKPHILYLVKALFKMLSHSEEDEKLYIENPVGFIRNFFDILSDQTLAHVASNLLNEVCLNIKGTLEVVINFISEVFNSNISTFVHKDAAFHVIGELSSLLLKHKKFACHLESFIVNYVIQVFHAPEGFIRARAFWLISQLGGVEFENMNVLVFLVNQTTNSILCYSDLPVRTMACVGLFGLLVKHEYDVKPLIDNYLHRLVPQILYLYRITEFDLLKDVLQSVILVFRDKMVPIAIDTVLYLSETLFSLLAVETFDDYKQMIIAGILSTIDSVCTSIEEHEHIVMELEPIILSIIEMLISKKAYNFYDYVYDFISSLTCKKISPAMWQVLPFLKTIIENKCDEIVDMMPLLTNFITYDKPSLVADQSRINTLVDICSIVLHSTDIDESFESNAAKLLEMILINYRGLVDNYIQRFIELVLVRLIRNVKCPELRTMCIQVVIASLYSNQELTLNFLLNNYWPNTNVLIFDEFLNRWYDNMDCFLGIHDRKLCIIGLGILISLNREQRPQSLQRLDDKIMPLLIKMMESLKNTYINNKEDENDEDEDDDVRSLGSDDCVEDSERISYMYTLNDDFDDSGNISEFPTDLERFPTDLDNKDVEMEELMYIDNIMFQLSSSDPDWYKLLVSSMTGSL